MKRSWKTYIAIGVVFAVSYLGAVLLPTSLAQSVMSTPAALALIAALYQIFRDEAAFEKQLKLKEDERFHALSISSHMAVVASTNMPNFQKNT